MIRTRFFKIGTIALLTGIPGCGSDASVGQANTPGATEIPELGISMEGLGAKVNSCNDGTNVGSSGNFDTTSKTMNVTLAAGSTVFSVIGTALTVNGWSCYDSSGVALTTANVKKMNITTTASATNKVVFDLLPGSFAPIFSTTGGVVIDFKDATDTFAVRGNTAANKMKIGESGGSLFVEASGDTKADIKLKGTIPTTLTFLMGDGADEFDGIDVAAVSATHIDSTALSLAKLPSTYTLKVYGGEGDDKLRGGLGNDTLYGNAGNDTFLTDKVKDGNDTYIGGAGNDTVSYADRTGAVTADISPTGFSAIGTVDLVSLAWDGATSRSILVTYDSDADGAITVADTAFTLVSATATSVATAVTQFNTTASKPAGLSVSVDSLNHLVIQSSVPFTTGNAAAETTLGVASASVLSIARANDGEATETDDIQSDVENLIGGKANDILSGNDVSNKITAGAGADIISGGIGAAVCTTDADSLDGGDGDDKFVMSPLGDCGDEIIGGAGTDLVDYQYRTAALKLTIDGSADDGLVMEADNIKADIEEVLGGSAADIITGGVGNKVLHGGAGDDVITGGAGNDTLIGNGGNDILNGAAGDDIFPTSGADSKFTVSGVGGQGEGADTINGGAGSDKLDYSARVRALTITLCTDAAALTGNSAVTTGQCADSDGGNMYTTTGTVSLTGGVTFASGDKFGVTAVDAAAASVPTNLVTLPTGALTTAQILAALNDSATGLGAGIVASLDSSGNLVLTAPDGIASITVDTTNSVNADDLLMLGVGGAGTPVAGTVSEGDKVLNIEWLIGGTGGDTLTGHTASETIEGGAGTDTLSGGAGDDTLFGDNGIDTLNGGDGNDTLNGGDGSVADGADALNGDNGDADICQKLGSDTTTTCEQF